MREGFNGIRFDKSQISVRDLHAPDTAHQYWWDKTPAQRLAALEYLRVHAYDYDPTTDSLPRVLKVVR